VEVEVDPDFKSTFYPKRFHYELFKSVSPFSTLSEGMITVVVSEVCVQEAEVLAVVSQKRSYFPL